MLYQQLGGGIFVISLYRNLVWVFFGEGGIKGAMK